MLSPWARLPRAESIGYSPSPGPAALGPWTWQAATWLPKHLICSISELRELGVDQLRIYRPHFGEGANAVVNLVETRKEPRTLLVVKEYKNDSERVIEEAQFARGIADGSTPFLCRVDGAAVMELPDTTGRLERKEVSVMDWPNSRSIARTLPDSGMRTQSPQQPPPGPSEGPHQAPVPHRATASTWNWFKREVARCADKSAPSGGMWGRTSAHRSPAGQSLVAWTTRPLSGCTGRLFIG